MFADFDARTSLTLLGGLRVYDDRQAWGRFMTLYLPMIQVWARRFGLSSDNAEELTGRLLTKLVEALPKFEYDPAKGTFRKWLKTVTQRELATFARERGRRPAGVAGAGGSTVQELLREHAQEIDSLVEGLHEQSELLSRALHAALVEVEAECQGEERKSWDMFRRIVLANEDIGPVAEAFGMSYHATAMRVQRIKKKVREKSLGLAASGPKP
jgi:RNA polymerase sigma-70 factor (ECF subfamily)